MKGNTKKQTLKSIDKELKKIREDIEDLRDMLLKPIRIDVENPTKEDLEVLEGGGSNIDLIGEILDLLENGLKFCKESYDKLLSEQKKREFTINISRKEKKEDSLKKQIEFNMSEGRKSLVEVYRLFLETKKSCLKESKQVEFILDAKELHRQDNMEYEKLENSNKYDKDIGM